MIKILNLTRQKKNLVMKNESSKDMVEDVNLTLSKFTKLRETLSKIVGSQRDFHNKLPLYNSMI